MNEQSLREESATQTGWRYALGKQLVVIGVWLMKDRPKKQSAVTLRYLLLELGLWGLALGSWVWLHPYIQTRSETVLVKLMTLIYAIFGAAIGGLCRRPGIGAFVGIGLALTLWTLQTIDR